MVQQQQQQGLAPAAAHPAGASPSPCADNPRPAADPPNSSTTSSSFVVVVVPSRKLRPSTMDFETMLCRLAAWKQQHLSAHVPRFCFDAPELGAWVRYVRKQHKDGCLEQWKADRLNELSFEWQLSDQEAKWHALFHQLRRHQLLYGSTEVDTANSSSDGCDWQMVARWLHRQGRLLAKQKLSGQKKAMLAQLGVALRLPRRLLHRTAQLQALNGPERRKLRKKWKKLDLAAAEQRWRDQQEQEQQQQKLQLQQQQVERRRLLLLLDAAQQIDAAAATSSSSSNLSLPPGAQQKQQQQALPDQQQQRQGPWPPVLAGSVDDAAAAGSGSLLLKGGRGSEQQGSDPGVDTLKQQEQEQQPSSLLQPLPVLPLVESAQQQSQRTLFYRRNRRPLKRRLHSRQEKWLEAEQG